MDKHIIWKEYIDKHSGDTYYYNINTKETTWDRPSSFPYDSNNENHVKPISWTSIPNSTWQIVETNTNEKYYYNKETNKTTWEIPEEIKTKIDNNNNILGKRSTLLDNNTNNEENEENEEEESEEEEIDSSEDEPPLKKQKIEKEEYEIITDPSIIEEFEELLEDFKVNQFSFWDLMISKLSKDERFNLIPCPNQKKKIFEEYAKNRAKKVEEKKKRAITLFNEHLNECITNHIYDFNIFLQKYKDSPALKQLKKDYQEELFNKKIEPLKIKETNELVNNRKLFNNLLMESKFIYYDSHWNDIKYKIRKDYRYNLIHSSKEREDLFYNYTKKLYNEKKYLIQNKNKYEKQRNHREHIDSRKLFQEKDEKTQLICLYTEYITKICSWDDVIDKLKDKSRFNTKYLSKYQKKELFNEHIKSLQESQKNTFYQLLKDINPPIPLGSIYETCISRLQKDSRFYSIKTDKERKHIFQKYQEYLLNEAEKGFKQLLRTMLTEITLSKSGPQYENALKIIKKDPRWSLLDLHSDRRDKLLKEFQSS